MNDYYTDILSGIDSEADYLTEGSSRVIFVKDVSSENP